MFWPASSRLNGGGTVTQPRYRGSRCAVFYMGLTLLRYPEWLGVSRQDLMHDSAELIQHLQALLLPHTGVIETRDSRLGIQHKVNAAVAAADSNAL